LNVALAPVEIGRNQRVDVGIDLEMFSGIEAGRYRKAEGYQNSRGGKACAGLDNRNNYLCQHISSFWVLAACRKRPLSSGVPRANLMLFSRFFALPENNGLEDAKFELSDIMPPFERL
jgi:hypothetical protein